MELSLGREGVGLAAGRFGGGRIGQLDVSRGEQLARSVNVYWIFDVMKELNGRWRISTCVQCFGSIHAINKYLCDRKDASWKDASLANSPASRIVKL